MLDLYPKHVQHNTIAKHLFVIALIIVPGFLSAQNLVTNGGFSSYTTGWSSSCSMEVNPEATYGGPSATNLVTEIDQERCLDQTICVFPGLTYKLTFKATRRMSSPTPATVGITVSVKGVTSNTAYVSQNKTYNNTSWSYTTTTYTFTVPSNSTDRKVTLHINDYNNSTTYGVLLDDIELHPQTDMSINGVTTAVINTNYTYSVNNAPTSGINYSWSLGLNATPATSTAATPSVKWSTAGYKTVSVDLSNGTCVVATLSTTVTVTGVLPVRFTSYSGTLTNNKAVINWATADEQNNAYLVVERSANGSNYDSVSRVQPGAAQSNNYSYTEANYNAISYYRIRQVDNNGSSTWSAIIILKSNSGNREMTVYPTMANSSIQYTISNDASAQALVQVFDFSGRIMINRSEALQQGVNLKTLDVSKLTTGAYILKVSQPATGSSSVKQFQKL